MLFNANILQNFKPQETNPESKKKHKLSPKGQKTE